MVLVLVLHLHLGGTLAISLVLLLVDTVVLARRKGIVLLGRVSLRRREQLGLRGGRDLHKVLLVALLLVLRLLTAVLVLLLVLVLVLVLLLVLLLLLVPVCLTRCSTVEMGLILMGIL